jgi:hypothetical protein
VKRLTCLIRELLDVPSPQARAADCPIARWALLSCALLAAVAAGGGGFA